MVARLFKTFLPFMTPTVTIIIIIIIITFQSQETDMIKKEAENILKYKDLTIEIQRMWNVKTKVIPVIIGATGTISKSFRKYMSNIQENMKLRHSRKQPHWALHTYFGKY